MISCFPGSLPELQFIIHNTGCKKLDRGSESALQQGSPLQWGSCAARELWSGKKHLVVWEKLYRRKKCALFGSFPLNISESNCVITSPKEAGNSTYCIPGLPKHRDSDMWHGEESMCPNTSPRWERHLLLPLSHAFLFPQSWLRKGEMERIVLSSLPHSLTAI